MPDTLFSTESADPLPQVKITPTLIQKGDNDDNAYQTRFSKIWRNDRSHSGVGRPLSLFAISATPDAESKHIVSVQTFDSFPIPFASPSSTTTAQPPVLKSKVWRHLARVPEAGEGLRFTFCLGRYGSFPIWVEEEEVEPVDPDVQPFPGLRLMGLFTEYKDGGTCHIKQMATPEGVPLNDLQCLDFDDAEGILCGITDTGVWIIEYS